MSHYVFRARASGRAVVLHFKSSSRADYCHGDLAEIILRSCNPVEIISRKTSFENPAEITLWGLSCGNLAEGLEYGLVMRHALLFVPADGSQHSLIISGDDLFKIRQIVRV